MVVDDVRKSPLQQAGDAAYEAMRALCREIPGRRIPAPVAYEVLGNLQGASGYMLVQVLQQLSQALQRSLGDPDLAIREDDGSDPADQVARARHLLDQGAALASDLSDLLASAQEALSAQSIEINDDPGPSTGSRRDEELSDGH